MIPEIEGKGGMLLKGKLFQNGILALAAKFGNDARRYGVQ